MAGFRIVNLKSPLIAALVVGSLGTINLYVFTLFRYFKNQIFSRQSDKRRVARLAIDTDEIGIRISDSK